MKKKVIELLLKHNVLRRDKPFQLKSGVISNYYYNFSNLTQNSSLHFIGSRLSEKNINVIFTSAYKGILLSAATALASENEVTISYLRKEVKGWGDESHIVGKMPSKTDRIMIVDDVLTSGKSILEIVDFLHGNNCTISEIKVVVDRSDKGIIEHIENISKAPLKSLVTHNDVVDYYEHLGGF